MENCIVANVLKFDTRTVNFCKLFTFLPKLFADNNISKSLKFEKSFSFSSCQIDLYIHLNNLMEISISVQNETLSLTIRVQREAIYVYPPSLLALRERTFWASTIPLGVLGTHTEAASNCDGRGGALTSPSFIGH